MQPNYFYDVVSERPLPGFSAEQFQVSTMVPVCPVIVTETNCPSNAASTMVPLCPIIVTESNCPSNAAEPKLPPPKPKRSRTTFTSHQIEQLEREFQRNTYMFRPQRIQTAQRLGLQERIVKIWFQNRRTKAKRLQKTKQDQPIKKEPQYEAGTKTHAASWTQPATAQPSTIALPTTLPIQAMSNMPPTPPATPDEIAEILGYLEATSGQEAVDNTSAVPSSSIDFDIFLQPAEDELMIKKEEPCGTDQSCLEAVAPAANLTWGEPWLEACWPSLSYDHLDVSFL